jgi:hypothetical protein
MNGVINYCTGWSLANKRALKPLTVDEARKRHAHGETYAVLRGGTDKPQCVVTVRLETGWIGVSFLDRELREYLAYSFSVKGKQIFLDFVVYREFEGTSDSIASATIYYFDPLGKVKVDKIQGETIYESLEKASDVSHNWESIPDFGEYESITRLDRDHLNKVITQ